MIYLIFSILCSALIGNLLFIFQKDEKSDILIIFLGNYILATIFSLISNNTPIHSIRIFDIGFGILTGFLFLFNFIIYQKNIIANGLSVSVGTMRISLMIPIFVSLFLFSEKIFLINYLGIAVILIGSIYITNTTTRLMLPLLFILFFVTGIQESMLKIYEVLGLEQKGCYIFSIFASALVFNFFWIVLKKKKFQVRSLLYGFALGIPNQLTTKFLLKGLETVPAAIAFPLVSSSIVIVTILSDIFIWKKQLITKQRVAFILMILGIIFLNMKI